MTANLMGKNMAKYGYIIGFIICMNTLSSSSIAAQNVRDFIVDSNTSNHSQSKAKRSSDFMNDRINLKVEDMSLKNILFRVEKETNVKFTYVESLLKPDIHHSFNFENLSFKKVLKMILAGTGIDYKILEGGYIVLKRHKKRVAIDAIISGTVYDGISGETLPGANIAIQGTTQGASSDADGHYEITGISPGTYTLAVTFVGYQRVTREITVGQNQNSLTADFTLQPAAQSLEKMVVVGYGEQKKADVSGSISSVGASDLEATQATNVEEALQGQAAGVLVTQSSGEPGAGVDVTIRGASTLGDTNPLYVIDGIPVNNEAGGNINEMATLNTDNIESIQILKDASAAAIYGSRAANGVVLITTKRGQAGKTRVQVSAKAGVSSIPKSRWIDMMNTQQFHEYSVDAYQSAGLEIPVSWQEPNLSQNLKQNTDWQAALFQPGTSQNYNITVSGGNDNAVYSFSSGYLDQEGNIVGNAFNRASFRINSEFYIGKDQNLTIGENIELSHSKYIGTTSIDDIKETLQQSPTVAVYDPDNLGGFAGPATQTSPGFRLNHVALLHLRDNGNTIQRLLGTAYVKYNFLPNLYYKLSLSTDVSEGKIKNFMPPYDLESNVNADADLEQSSSERRAMIAENTLNYDLSLNENHDFKFLAGFTREKRDYESISATAIDFPNNDLRTINSALGLTTVQGGATASALESYLGRVQYSFKDRYRAQFAIRRDGSSRFGSERRWGTFPSASASWLINNESFMDRFKNFSQFTLRAGWGVTGSQQIPDFAAIPTVNPVANYIFGTDQALTSGSAVLEVGNPKLQWQETKQLDIGLDLGLWDNILSFNIDYYKKNTSDLLIRLPVVTTSGIRRDNGAYQNIGEVQNTGLEFNATYQKSIGDFSYRLNGNFSTFKNKVKYLGVPSVIVTVSDELGNGQTITQPGSEIGAFYGYVSEGPFRDQEDVDSHATQPGAAPGDLKFKDLNNDGVIDGNDRTIIGSPFPDFHYGLTLNLNYKNWGARIQMDGVQGRDIMDLRADNDVKGFNNVVTDYLDRWTPDNRDGTEPRANTNDPNGNLRSSTYRVKDGSYLAIRNVTLDYDFNTEALKRLVNLSNLRVFVSGRNLFWFTSYDGYNPEIGTTGSGNRASLTRSLDQGTYPIARTFEMGIDFSF